MLFSALSDITMNKIEIANLTEILRLDYSHICLNPHNIDQFINIPIHHKNFYPFYRKAYPRKGAFNNGKTICWADWSVDSGHIKISVNQKMPADLTHGWSDQFSFKEEDSVMKIYKLTKLKAFW
jgi:hypothetical protein